jgi:gliding motility-associated-like protein
VNTGDVTNGNSLTQYTIQYTTNGVCPSSSIESITSLDCTVDPEIIIPTAFTPDGDGVNDTWEILGLDTNYPNNIVRIYNRWGALIYEHEASISDTYGMNEWDGTFNGQKLPVSSFYYIIDYNDGSEISVNGTVTLVEM